MKKIIRKAWVIGLLLALMGVSFVVAEEVDATGYTYEIIPVLHPFCYCVYVRTDNPDPFSFRFRDPESKYGEETWWEQDETLFSDVRYEDVSRYRVKGGYIFSYLWDLPDGGSVILQKRTTGQYYDGKQIRTYTDYKDTDVSISCPKLKNGLDVLIELYTNDGMSFWEKLDAIQQALNRLAVYPRKVSQTNSPNEDRPWPYLATSPYAELTLNEHYEMFNSGKMLLQSAYPYVLDSLGFPGMIRKAALRFEPGCTVVQDNLHWNIQVTWNGETRKYGGAGEGGYDPINSDQLESLFTFDESENDWFETEDPQKCHDKLVSYRDPAAESQQQYRDMIAGNTFQKTINQTKGTWIRASSEYHFSDSFSYLIPQSGRPMIVSDAWVDGRYIGEHEDFVAGEHFADHPTAGIVVPDKQITLWGGEERIQDVLFVYQPERDRWEADVTSFAGYGSTLKDGDQLPEEWYLTKSQIQAMAVDRNTFTFPASGLIYDGKSKPGTPFSCVTVTYYAANGKNGSEGMRVSAADKDVPFALSAGSIFDPPGEPADLIFKAWLIDGKEYKAGRKYTPHSDFSATAVWQQKPAEPQAPGDVNDDGQVDGRDAIRLMKWLAGEIDPETGEEYEINETEADLTGDGIVDELDLLRLMKYLGGEEVLTE